MSLSVSTFPASGGVGPRVELVEDGVGLPAYSISVQWATDNETGYVREFKRKDVSFPALIVDYGAPFNTPITYTVTGYGGSGSVVGTTKITTTLTVNTPPGLAWVHDPNDPKSAMLLKLSSESGSSFEFKSNLGVYDVQDSRYPIAIGGRMGMHSKFPFHVLTEGIDQRRKFEKMFAEGGPAILFRTVPPFPLPRVAHIATDGVQVFPVDAERYDARELWTWQFSGQVVRGPSASYAVSVYTWADVKANYPTWGDLLAAKPKWLDVLRNPMPGA